MRPRRLTQPASLLWLVWLVANSVSVGQMPTEEQTGLGETKRAPHTQQTSTNQTATTNQEAATSQASANNDDGLNDDKSTDSDEALSADEVAWFESQIRPLLIRRCYECHSAESGKTHGGLALDIQAGWQVGGDSGPAIVPGDMTSLLIAAIEYGDAGPQMPPVEVGGKLPDSEIELLKRWVRTGAVDPRRSVALRGGLTPEELRGWWAFQPLVRDELKRADDGAAPQSPVSQSSVSQSSVSAAPRGDSAIDGFISRSLEQAGLGVAEAADRRTLIRRATYDLTGLPPTAAEVDAFVADNDPNAYARLLDRLLNSPRYGERWGRHWLDVIRYADTAGENTDHPIPDAWRFRNWVIDALNRDMPYDQFIRDQLAGDLIHARGTPEEYSSGVIATGYLAIARRFDHDSDKHMHLTYEDTLDTLGRSVLGLSIACARCHDHKYDPISAEDYYALYGILDSTRFAFPGCEAKQQPRDLVPLSSDEQWAATIAPHDLELAEVDEQLAQLQAGPLFGANLQGVEEGNRAVGQEDGSVGRAFVELVSGEVSEGGEVRLSAEQPESLGSLPVMVPVEPGELLRLTIDPHGNYGADTTLLEWTIAHTDSATGQVNRWDLTSDALRGFNAVNPLPDSFGNATTWWLLDARSGSSLLGEFVDGLEGQSALQAWRSGDNPSVFVNQSHEPVGVWTTLPPRSLFVHPAADGPVAIAWMSPVAGEVQVRVRIADAHPGGPNGVLYRLERGVGDYRPLAGQLLSVAKQRPTVLERRAALVASRPVRQMAYAVTDREPVNARLQQRGDPTQLGPEVPRRWLELFGGQPLPEQAGSGRLELAVWLTDPHNPLTARVMVNRIWLHHFGRGLVATPNDFGTRGEKPSHPELLDWLASEFIRSGWSIKALHRLIMESAAYRRGSSMRDLDQQQRALEVDPNNRLLWCFERRRLSAEELRDSLLVASGQIDWTAGQAHPIAPQETWSFTQHVPFAGVAETPQRSVYLMTLRNRRQPFLGLFDGADPNASTPQRQVTTVPTQALYFMNDPWVHAQADRMLERVEGGDDAARLMELYRIALQRAATPAEMATAEKFLAQYCQAIEGEASASVVSRADETTTTEAASKTTNPETHLSAWRAFARVILSSNEFLYVD